jgi:SRSO17 transposase
MDPITIPPMTGARLLLLEEYTAQFRDLFRRADQARGFHLYLEGLLDGDHRKNIESIATRNAAADEAESRKAAQSLHHFVNQSPWEAQALIARYRALLRPVLADKKRIWVIHDGFFPKKGRNSVGVQRQFAHTLGRKVNCQLGVVVSQLGPQGYAPLAMRLYLPKNWLKEYADVALRTVPLPYRVFTSKAEIAIQLIEEIQDSGLVVPDLAGENGYLTAIPFQEELQKRKWQVCGSGALEQFGMLQRAIEHFEWLKANLGIDHFEGRTWMGWHHHVALVLAAYGFLRWETSFGK